MNKAQAVEAAAHAVAQQEPELGAALTAAVVRAARAAYGPEDARRAVVVAALRDPQLVGALGRDATLMRHLAQAVVPAFLGVVVREVALGGRVSITGMGSWHARMQAAAVRRNPVTGAPVHVPPTRKVRFTVGDGFARVVAGDRPLLDGVNPSLKKPKGPRRKG